MEGDLAHIGIGILSRALQERQRIGVAYRAERRGNVLAKIAHWMRE